MRCTCSLSFVVVHDGFPDHSLVIKTKHDGSKGMPVVVNHDASSICPCGVRLVGVDKFLHGVFLVTVRHCTGEPLEAHR